MYSLVMNPWPHDFLVKSFYYRKLETHFKIENISACYKETYAKWVM